MSLDKIGFYTLTDARCATASADSPLMRGEILLTGRCNFTCPYCRRVGGPDLDYEQAEATVRLLASERLQNIRFSGGEPTLFAGLPELCELARDLGVQRIAVSSNGSRPWHVYARLLEAGVNDFSISLDACCAEDGDKMAGGVKGAWEAVVANIRALAARTYTTVGIVLTEDNAASALQTIRLADTLGVADIRIIPAAQVSDRLGQLDVPDDLLAKYPILAYRMANLRSGKAVRGLAPDHANRCPLALDDVAIMGGKHYPCIIYLRENGDPIGEIGPAIRSEREDWARQHDTKTDPICSRNCLDVCAAYNTQHRGFPS